MDITRKEFVEEIGSTVIVYYGQCGIELDRSSKEEVYEITKGYARELAYKLGIDI